MKTVRAKFQVGNVEQVPGTESRTIYMYPVYSSDPESENKKFTDATPAGQFTMTITFPETAAFFEPGKEYYLDITKVEPPTA